MTERVRPGEIIVNSFNQEKNLMETAADLGAIILEMEREKKYYGEHTERMTELKKMAAVQEKVVNRMLERSVKEPTNPKRSHLKVVK
jgi:hypothetical protein